MNLCQGPSVFQLCFYLFVLLGGGHSPDGIPNVICNQKYTGLIQRNPDRSSHCVAVLLEKSIENQHRVTRRHAPSKRDEDHLIAIRLGAIPRTMLRHEHPILELSR